MLLADCKGRAFTPLWQQLPARAIQPPNKQNAVLRLYALGVLALCALHPAQNKQNAVLRPTP